ncbi:MAG TPA: DUF86 domain-containing protein [Deinococcales bacterium]|nr:DUF86 domain-containing protein [Deinococcales bacterium]
MQPRDWRDRVRDIIAAAESARRFAADLPLEQFARDEQRRSAVAYQLMILGEAAGALPPEVRERIRHFPWQELRGLRNRIAHAYFDLEPSIIWAIVQDDLPTVLAEIPRLLDE